jgi:hypothetical protein
MTTDVITVIPQSPRIISVIPRETTKIVSVIAVGPQGPVGPMGQTPNSINDITGLQAALDGKAALIHTHVVNDITDFDGTVLSGGTF